MKFLSLTLRFPGCRDSTGRIRSRDTETHWAPSTPCRARSHLELTHDPALSLLSSSGRHTPADPKHGHMGHVCHPGHGAAAPTGGSRRRRIQARVISLEGALASTWARVVALISTCRPASGYDGHGLPGWHVRTKCLPFLVRTKGGRRSTNAEARLLWPARYGT